MNPSQALVRAVRDLIRSEAGVRASHCDEHEDHRPPARSGQYYISVFPTQYSLNGDSEAQHVLDRSVGVSLGISQRTGVVASDRMLAEMQKEHGVLGLYHVLDALLRNKRYMLLKCAEDLLAGDWEDGQFVEPLRRSGGTLEIMKASPEHFRSEPYMRDGTPNCVDIGAYLVLPFEGARYMQSLETAVVGEGINYWVIEQDFVVGEDLDTSWTENTYVAEALVNARSGGYGAFSGDSQFVAMRVGETSEWRIYGRDGSVRVVEHSTGGASLQDFMWSRDNDYFWLTGNTLSLFSLGGSLINAWTLPTAPDGKSVQWRSGTGSNGEKQFVIGSHHAGGSIYEHYIQAIDRMGPQEAYWVENLPGRDEVKWHNIFLRDGFGYGGSLSGDDQGDVYAIPYDGSEVVQVYGDGTSHESFKGNEVLTFESANDGLELKNVGTDTVVATISQQDLKDVIGTTTFVAGGHCDLRGEGAVLSVNINGTNDWYILYWNRHKLTKVYGPFYSPRPTSGSFSDAVLPSISPDNRYVAFQDAGGVRIVDV